MYNIINEILKTNNPTVTEYIDNKIFRYFNVDMEISINNQHRHLKYSFRPSFSKTNFYMIEVELNSHKHHFTCKYCGIKSNTPCNHIIALLQEINNGKYEDVTIDINKIEKRFVSEENRIAEKVFEENRAKYEKYLQNIITQIEQEEAIPIKDKVSLLPIIKIERHDNYQQYFIGLKIGIDKFYVIKDIDAFMKQISCKENVRYGKNLEFVHDKKNFTDKSLVLLENIEPIIANNSLRNPRYLPINSRFLDLVIMLSQDDTIVFEEKELSTEAIITNQKIDIELEIVNDVLQVKKLQNILYLYGKEHDYVITNNHLFIANVQDEVRALTAIIASNESFQLQYAPQKFIDEIYTRYHQYIDVTEEFKEKHPIQDLVIEAYFDYENSDISLTTKYKIGDVEVDINSLKNQARIYNRLSRYRTMIESLGFTNDIITDEEKIATFMKADLSSLKKVATVFLSESLRKVQIKTFTKFNANLGYNNGMLDICFEDLNYSDAELYAILSAIRKKKRFARLTKDTIVEINDDFATKFLRTVEEFDLDAKHLTETQTKPLYQTLKLLGENEEYIQMAPDKVLREMLEDIAKYKEAEYCPPAELLEVMREYQVDAFKWIKTLIKYNFCGILADDMGLGKTLEMISVIMSDEANKPSIIVCPKSLAYNWKNEFHKWAPDIKVVNINGMANERAKMIASISKKEKTIYITSYDSLRNDLDYYKEKKFRFMILDEAQFIKNHATLKAKSVKQVKSELRFVLTGTPIENTVVDLWSIFDFLMPNYLYNFTQFKSRFEKDITQYFERDTIELLVKKITPFILRRTKNEVLQNLPEKIETIRYATMTEEQRKLYEAQLLVTKDLLLSKDKFMILQSLTRLRQLSVNPGMFIDDYHGGSAKTDLVIELIEELTSNNHKILLFSQFTSAFPDIEEALKKMNIPYFIITGKTEAESRFMMAEQFNKEDSKEKVFLVSLKAGGTGLNLIGADIVIHLDPWWNVAAENQATDRAHRIGQNRIVQVIKIVCEDSIEQKVIELQQLKQNVVDAVIAKNDDNIVNLSKEDLQYLLS